MYKRYIEIKALRTGYSVEQVSCTMTVGDLIAALQQFDEDLPVYLNHDNGYTFGPVLEENIEETEQGN